MSTETSPPEELTAVQERLFEMLNSVSLDTPRQRTVQAETPAPSAPVKTKEPPAAKRAKPRHPTDCSNCGASEALKSSTWCQTCGYHPRLNRCLEVEAPESEEDSREPTIGDMLNHVPIWAWILGGGILSVILFSGFIRAGLPDIQERSQVALMMVFCGLLSFVLCHVRAFYIGLQNSEKFNLGTMIAHPVETWRPAAQQLPDTRRLFYGMAWGLTAVFMAVLIVGIDWNGLFKPSEKKKASFNPLAMIMKAAVCMSGVTNGGQQGDAGGVSAMGEMMDAIGEATPEDEGGANSENVEGALEDFAGKALDDSIDDSSSNKKANSVENPEAALEEMKSRDGLDDNAEKPFQLPKTLGSDGKLQTQIDDDSQGKEAEKTSLNEKSTDDEDQNSQSEGPTLTALRNVTLPTTERHATATETTGLQDDFLIFGYTLSVTGRMHSVVIAELTNANRGRYVATVPVDQLAPADLDKLQQQLDEKRSNTPALRAPVRARWVIPVFTCTVAYKDRTSVGTLKDPQFISYHTIGAESSN